MRRLFTVLVDRPALSRARGKRGDSERGDPIALLAQHFEAEAMKAESLTRLGNRARLVNHEAGHRRGFVVRQIPADRAIELADRGGAIHHDRAVPLFAHPQHRNVVLIVNIADDLLDNVLKGDQPLHNAVLVDDERRMGLSAQELLELVAQRRGFGDEPGIEREIAVLFCAPFGWEDMGSYPVRAVWAQRLAAAGHPVLRFDLPGTGQSAGTWGE